MKLIRFTSIALWYILISPVVMFVGIIRVVFKMCEGYGVIYAFKSTIRGIISGHRINMLYVRFGKNPSIEDFES